MGATRFRAGKDSAATVGGTLMAVEQWSSKYSGDKLPTNNFESNGLREGLIGFVGLAWSLKGSWDATENPLADPPGLFPRDDGANMTLTTNVTDGSHFSMPLWICSDSDVASTATGLVTFDANGESQGNFTVP